MVLFTLHVLQLPLFVPQLPLPQPPPPLPQLQPLPPLSPPPLLLRPQLPQPLPPFPPPLLLRRQLPQPPLLSIFCSTSCATGPEDWFTGIWIVTPLSSMTETDSWGTLTETTFPGPLGVLSIAPICGIDCFAWM